MSKLDQASAPQSETKSPSIQRSTAAPGKTQRTTQLPSATQSRMESSFGTGLDSVTVHPASPEVSGDTHALTQGNDIHFAPGKFAPETSQGDWLIAHELAHVTQQRGGGTHRQAFSGSRQNWILEQDADQAADRAVAGQPADVKLAATSGTIQHFGGGKKGHGGIDEDAAGSAAGSKGQKEIHAGNTLRDLNQLNVPLVVTKLAGVPKDPTKPKGEKLGAEGATELTSAIVKAMLIMDLGPEVAGAATKANIGVYRPDEHFDNPMGLSGEDVMVGQGDNKKQDPTKGNITVGDIRPAKATVDASGKPQPDAERDAQLKSSSGKGLMVENPDLYKASGTGIANHMYNTTETVKKNWTLAASSGANAKGRMYFGNGMHSVQDYFAHSNFVEVALNSYIDKALAQANSKLGAGNETATKFAQQVAARVDPTQKGADGTVYYVDSMYDDQVADPNNRDPQGPKRQVVTSGSFLGLDTKVSIAHMAASKLPALQDAAFTAIDRLFAIEGGAKGGGIKAALGTDKAGSAAAVILEGLNSAGMTAPVPRIALDWANYNISPGVFGDPWSVRLPDGLPYVAWDTKPLGTAASEYHAMYKQAMAIRAKVKAVLEYAKYVSFPLAGIVDKVDELVKEAKNRIMSEVKAQVTAILVGVLDSITGRSEADKAAATKARKEKLQAEYEKRKARDGWMSATGWMYGQQKQNNDDELKAYMGDAIAYAESAAMTEMETDTSLESQLDHGDLAKLTKAQVEARDGPVEPIMSPKKDKDGKTVRTGWRAKNPLPPSHTELAKDYAPDKAGEGLKKHGKPSAGSSFYGIARTLATDVTSHCEGQLQTIWSKSGGTVFGDGKKYAYSSAQKPGDSADIHDKTMADADKYAGDEKKRADKEGRTFGQDKVADTDAKGLLNLADYFISHPDDAGWWKPIMDSYVAANEETVIQAILARNKTRGKRQ